MDCQIEEIPPKFRKLFYIIFSTNLLINLDHGIIPAASITIEQSLGMSNDQLGILGSLVYAGIGIVGIFMGKAFTIQTPGRIVIISLLTMILTLLLFTITYGVTFPYYILRFITGAAQAPLLIYFPVWVDHFGGKQKTIWLTMLQGGVPFGVFIGYVLSSIIQSQWNWRWSFYLQAGALAPCCAAFWLIKHDDFDVRQEENSDDKQNTSFNRFISQLFKKKVYVFTVIALCVLYFTVTGIQFWISNYLETVLGEPRHKVNIVFSIVSITAPTIGCVLGGSIIQSVGGYESRQALPFSLGCAIIGCGSALPVPFIDNFWLICGLIWLLLFFGGAMVPVLTGIMITSVSSQSRSFANSTSTTFINLFGYLPAPSVYGSLSTINDKAGITFLMTYPCVVVVSLCAALLSIKQNTSEQVDEAKNDEAKNDSESNLSGVELNIVQTPTVNT